MTDVPISNQCADGTRQIVINIIRQLACGFKNLRPRQTGNTITNRVIEALDALLMKAMKKW